MTEPVTEARLGEAAVMLDSPEFAYRGGELFAEDVALSKLAAEAGTPFYCYSASAIERQYRRFADAFGGLDALLCYSLKANSNLSVVATLARLGAGADVVSEGEFRRALAAGIPGSRIIFSGIGKTEAELAFALANGVYQINVESLPELEALNRVARKMNRVAPVAIRVNPDVDARTHAMISTGKKENKFGIDLELAAEAYREAAQMHGIAPVGMAVHIGSQLTALGPFEIAFGRVIALLRSLRADGIELKRFDFGGGLGIRYRDETPPSVEDYASVVKHVTDGLNLSLAFEPGRAIVGNAGVLVSRVLYVKEGVSHRFVIVDAAMNDLLRPALYGDKWGWHDIVPVKAPDPRAEHVAQSIVGPVCETGDAFALDRPLAPLRDGDLVAILSAGAYGAVMSSSYNSRLKVPELLVKGADAAIIRKRPSYETMLAQDQIAPWLASR
ncbi:MAG TPA: diaminopimelate decarboxylase [Stellaceae bacterium]|nr:diaminopimelate decarboxylase [Stellaceae bacterium]